MKTRGDGRAYRHLGTLEKISGVGDFIGATEHAAEIEKLLEASTQKRRTHLARESSAGASSESGMPAENRR